MRTEVKNVGVREGPVYRAGTESRVVGKGGKSREVCNFGWWVIIFDLST